MIILEISIIMIIIIISLIISYTRQRSVSTIATERNGFKLAVW